jgi:SAM-dependent methyltransferase
MEVARVVDLTFSGLENVSSVLDIGMGSGLFAEAFAAKGLRVAGVDANPEMIPAAQSFVPQVIFKVGTAEELLFADGEFDVAFMSLLLHETDDAAKAVQESLSCLPEAPGRAGVALRGTGDRSGNGGTPACRRGSSLGENSRIFTCEETRLKKFILYRFNK